ncbi:MAG TPA: tRNA (adenosine(37)-N6)-threonylcarbamoyltransferase complex ATPase subunit type 1 TsaE [Terriglobia bacterium]|nr:tRNA (adenosine(37)-N6)-threonylcarbamoyltransferase complex ATPase subunit type 1 TsaE [Terriglobia bacterium]
MKETLYDIVTGSPEETLAFGRKLAKSLQPPCTALLEGDLGSGKTTLTKGVAAGLGAAREEDVTSPTFTLVHEYSGSSPEAAGRGFKVYHVDLYRIDGLREIESLGLEELFQPWSTVMIEWGEKLPQRPLGSIIRIRMEVLAENQRRIIVEKES